MAVIQGCEITHQEHGELTVRLRPGRGPMRRRHARMIHMRRVEQVIVPFQGSQTRNLGGQTGAWRTRECCAHALGVQISEADYVLVGPHRVRYRSPRLVGHAQDERASERLSVRQIPSEDIASVGAHVRLQDQSLP